MALDRLISSHTSESDIPLGRCERNAECQTINCTLRNAPDVTTDVMLSFDPCAREVTFTRTTGDMVLITVTTAENIAQNDTTGNVFNLMIASNNSGVYFGVSKLHTLQYSKLQ